MNEKSSVTSNEGRVAQGWCREANRPRRHNVMKDTSTMRWEKICRPRQFRENTDALSFISGGHLEQSLATIMQKHYNITQLLKENP
ncbi:Uncharacterized protein HZ326_3289 [Fusarium oxysporum f. sp. albedinis]|nr:Uncharacterized protein HZ326_3289 [Fusarium oxysporum f. sp. albedinis]